MPHPSHGNMSKSPVVLRMNKTHDPLPSCQGGCCLKLLHPSRNVSTGALFRHGSGQTRLINVVFVRRGRGSGEALHASGRRGVVPMPEVTPSPLGNCCACVVHVVRVFTPVHKHKHRWRAGGEEGWGVLPASSVSVNLRGCGAAVDVCVWMFYFPLFCLVLLIPRGISLS